MFDSIGDLRTMPSGRGQFSMELICPGVSPRSATFISDGLFRFVPA